MMSVNGAEPEGASTNRRNQDDSKVLEIPPSLTSRMRLITVSPKVTKT